MTFHRLGEAFPEIEFLKKSAVLSGEFQPAVLDGLTEADQFL
jgi:hypothetical protein